MEGASSVCGEAWVRGMASGLASVYLVLREENRRLLKSPRKWGVCSVASTREVREQCRRERRTRVASGASAGPVRAGAVRGRRGCRYLSAPWGGARGQVRSGSGRSPDRGGRDVVRTRSAGPVEGRVKKLGKPDLG